MAVLSFVTSIVMKLILAITGAAWILDMFSSILPQDQHSLTHTSIERGGSGSPLTTLIISTPPWLQISSMAHWRASCVTPRLVALFSHVQPHAFNQSGAAHRSAPTIRSKETS